MTPAQISKLRWITTQLNQFAKWEGGLTFHQENCCGSVLLVASNTETSQWFHTSICVVLLIGPRGGVRISGAVGLERKYIEGCCK